MENIEKKLNMDQKITSQQMRRELTKIFHPAIYGDEAMIKEINVAYDAAQEGNTKPLEDIYKKYIPVVKKIDIRDKPRYDKPRKSYIT